jgi:hypothetical protein
VESKSKIKQRKWFEENKNMECVPVSIIELNQYGVPDSIIDKMKCWDIIMKSPLSNSFYSAVISLDYKPNGCLRVSSHWNFISKRDGKIHCKTKQTIKNDAKYYIGEFDLKDKKYDIIFEDDNLLYLKEMEEKTRIKEIFGKKAKYFKSDEVINKKRIFAKKFKEGKIEVCMKYKHMQVNGILKNYDGRKISIIDNIGQDVYSNVEFNNKKAELIFIDDAGVILEDPFILPDVFDI